MSEYTHETVPTRFVEADGIRYAYRRFGRAGTVPLLFLEYFNSNMDGWDPAVTNGLAADNEVILFDNAGVGASGGHTPYTVKEMADHCVTFCGALGLKVIHVVGAVNFVDDVRARLSGPPGKRHGAPAGAQAFRRGPR
jgi:hypothetical protein